MSDVIVINLSHVVQQPLHIGMCMGGCCTLSSAHTNMTIAVSQRKQEEKRRIEEGVVVAVVVVVCVFVCIPGASLNETTTTKPTH